MLRVRKAKDRGFTNQDWLISWHTFSFAAYHAPDFMGFRTLRVINEDHIKGGAGFASHPHRNMEIITYVIKGALEHKDSMGNSSIILPDEVQRISAGNGIYHSEHNHKRDEETHLFQIWILCDKHGYQPSYDQKSFRSELATKNLVLAVSNHGRDNSISIHQDADIYISRLQEKDKLSYRLKKSRHAWLQMVHGKISVNTINLESSDGIAVSEEEQLNITALTPSEFLLFDLA